MQYPPASSGDTLPGFWPENDDVTPGTDPAQRADLDAFIAECVEGDARYEAQRAHEEYLQYHDGREEWLRNAVQRQDRG